MSLQTRLSTLITAIGADIKALQTETGRLTAARAYRNAAKTFTSGSGSWQKVELDTIDHDAGARFNVAGADGTATKGRYTAPVSGFYQVSASIGVVNVGSGTGPLIVAIYRNGVEASRGTRILGAAAGNAYNLVVADLVYCAAGQYLEFFYYTTKADTIGTGIVNTYMSVFKVIG